MVTLVVTARNSQLRLAGEVSLAWLVAVLLKLQKRRRHINQAAQRIMGSLVFDEVKMRREFDYGSIRAAKICWNFQALTLPSNYPCRKFRPVQTTE